MSPTLWLMLWCVQVALSCAASCAVGWFLVDRLRKLATTTDTVWKLTIPIFTAPLCTCILLNIFSRLGFCDRVVADAFSFGIVLGIVVKLNATNAANDAVKLVVVQPSGKSIDVWLNGLDVKVTDARSKIAEELKLAPSRVCFESGRGTFIEELTAPLIPIINADDANCVTDFFGFTTITCYIFIKEEEDVPVPIIQERDDAKPKNSFISLLHTRGADVKFGDQYILNARSPLSADLAAFYIQAVDKFAGATPTQSTSTIRFVNFDSSNSNEIDVMSEAGDTTHSSGGGSVTKSSARSAMHKITHSNVRVKHPGDGLPLKNGDTVVLECDEKYMNVTRGWWMAWSSAAPRRSGAFKIEITDRAAANTLKEQLGKKIGAFGRPSISLGAVGGMGGMNTLGALGAINNSKLENNHGAAAPSASSHDNILRTGDLFRLRSVKFPEYELGVTNERLRDDFCYLGLRKIDNNDNDSWCVAVKFSVKSNSLANDIFNNDLFKKTQ